MKASLFVTTLFLLLAGGSFRLHAQTTTNTPNPQIARELRMISFLSPAQQQQYAQARAQALADNPELKTEGEKVAEQGINALAADATAADKQAFMEAMASHRQKLRQAMLKEDPTLVPIFAEIDKHLAEMRAKQQTTAPPASPSSGQ